MKHLVFSIALLLSSVVITMSLGSSEYSLFDCFQVLFKSFSNLELTPRETIAKTILFEIRFPRILVAGTTGASLAAAGVISQGHFRNSLASPSILGTTTGGSLAAASMFYFGAAYTHWFSLPLAAFLGASGATFILFFIAKRFLGFHIQTLLLTGFALNALLAAITSLIISLMLEDQQKTAAVMHWLMGGFAAKGMEHFWMVLPTFVIGLFFAVNITKKLDVLSLGEEIAQTLSIDLRKLWRSSIFCLAILVGGAVSVAGAIPFVGLIIPHITRIFCGPKHQRLLVLSALNGASLVLIADLAARTIRTPQEFEVGVLISLLGAPFFMWLLSKKKTGGTL
jgi:iron complex transport system permease protein